MNAGTPLADQLQRMERAAQSRAEHARVTDRHVTMSHGSGGKATWNLIEGLLRPAFDNPLLDALGDAAVLATPAGRLAFTTDAFVVRPLFFPGGDIGRLAIHGSINDLAMSGAEPLGLSVALILEEGLDMEMLRRVVASLAEAAREAGVSVVTGDTKVVDRGKADGLYITTSAIGLVRAGSPAGPATIRPGDRVLLSGNIAEHGIAVMLAREALELETPVRSDSAPLHGLARAVLDAAPGTRVLKDPTRGGVATSLNEIAAQACAAIVVNESSVPVTPAVRGACEILGIDPLHMANEGKLLAIVPAAESDAALAALRGHPLGRGAALIGEVAAEPARMVLLRTAIGGTRVLDMLVGDALPRIC